jgi:hypothetical protein
MVHKLSQVGPQFVALTFIEKFTDLDLAVVTSQL